MAGPFFVDDAGTSPDGLAWATAYTSIKDADAAKAFASGEIVYFGADMQCQATHSVALTIIGPTANEPVYFISSTVGAGTTVSYSASTTNQIDTSEGAYGITFDGSFALYGLSIKSGQHVTYLGDADEVFYADTHRVALGANGTIYFGNNQTFENLTVDLTADGTTSRSGVIFQASTAGTAVINGLTFVNPQYRTGVIFGLGTGTLNVSGADFSGFAVGCEIVNNDTGNNVLITNSITAATWTPTLNTMRNNNTTTFMNVGPADAPTYLYIDHSAGNIVSSASIYRTGGATVETEALSYLVTTNTRCSEGWVLPTPWIYGEVSSTGSKTFTVHITNDTADFTDAQVWLDVEYLGTADEANTTLASGHRVITDTAATTGDISDDTTSTWVGLNNSGQGLADYMQKISVTATVGETGQYRARVCVGVASIASSRYFYIDPKVTVS